MMTALPGKPFTIVTNNCLYDAPLRTMYGHMCSIDTNFPEWIAVESHISGARFLLRRYQAYIFDGGRATYKPGNHEIPFDMFFLFKTRESMISGFKDIVRG